MNFTEYCVGTTTGQCQVQEMRRIPENQTRVTCFDCKLKHGYKYFMTIRAWNKASLFSLATTEGIKANFTPPINGKVMVDNSYMPCVNCCTLTATFSGFKDDESGIRNCEYSVKAANGSIVAPTKLITSGNRAMAHDLRLQHKEMYHLAVTCTNMLGEESVEVYLPPVKIDNTPPAKVR